MAQPVRILESVVRQVRQHPCASTFWKLHERLTEADDPFDPIEVDCIPAPSPKLRKEVFAQLEDVIVFYWQHPDGDVEIHDVLLPDQ